MTDTLEKKTKISNKDDFEKQITNIFSYRKAVGVYHVKLFGATFLLDEDEGYKLDQISRNIKSFILDKLIDCAAVEVERDELKGKLQGLTEMYNCILRQNKELKAGTVIAGSLICEGDIVEVKGTSVNQTEYANDKINGISIYCIKCGNKKVVRLKDEDGYYCGYCNKNFSYFDYCKFRQSLENSGTKDRT